MPKSMAIRQTEKLSLWTAIPLYVFYRLINARLTIKERRYLGKDYVYLSIS